MRRAKAASREDVGLVDVAAGDSPWSRSGTCPPPRSSRTQRDERAGLAEVTSAENRELMQIPGRPLQLILSGLRLPGSFPLAIWAVTGERCQISTVIPEAADLVLT